jgi:hypothetical protein
MKCCDINVLKLRRYLRSEFKVFNGLWEIRQFNIFDLLRNVHVFHS